MDFDDPDHSEDGCFSAKGHELLGETKGADCNL
jgi:hypothetical protein